MGWLPKQSISSSKFRSGIEGFSRTECPFKSSWFGLWGGFPNKVSPLQSFVRELRYFPEQNVSFGKIRSGKRVIFRTKCLCCGEKEFFLPLCPGGLSYRSRNWEESPGRKGQCTVESTDRRRVYARVTENYRRRSLIYWNRRAQSGWPMLYSGNRKQPVRWSTLR